MHRALSPMCSWSGFCSSPHPSGCLRRMGMGMVCPSSPAAVSGSPAWPCSGPEPILLSTGGAGIAPPALLPPLLAPSLQAQLPAPCSASPHPSAKAPGQAPGFRKANHHFQQQERCTNGFVTPCPTPVPRAGAPREHRRPSHQRLCSVGVVQNCSLIKFNHAS